MGNRRGRGMTSHVLWRTRFLGVSVDMTCPACRGCAFLMLRIPEFAHCQARPCHDHLQHFQRVWCIACLGSGRASVPRLVWRFLQGLKDKRTAAAKVEVDEVPND